MTGTNRSTLTTAAILAAGLLLTTVACSSTGTDSGKKTTLSIVASTSVYGDIAKSIAGDAVPVTSIISDLSQDPHSFEADPRTQLTLSKARIVIKNGGGYDDFVDKMLRSAGKSDRVVLDAVDISGKTAPSGGDLNEHLWYDFPTAIKVAAKVSSVLSSQLPSHASTFATNLATFTAAVTALEQSEAQVKAAHNGVAIAITEPVPLYLLEACGLKNVTPGDFSKGVEEGEDISPAALAATLKLFSSHSVALLANNAQTSGKETMQVVAAARANNIAVIDVTETLPPGKDYVSWMSSILAAVRTALG
jgi:zinc/manganese transport system substrate-binding protein